ncbi:helix-turn-helix domain-containing protein [Halobacillus naozhouensis]|uniref:Helix-turn-helix domain-containing protein n=1 Tax=Halobacillus naozhouensis TaxID=554880 RepID=A0ABY8J687_9BACI|nr:helix-turn-helix domain-containing protein [Halobacillus naozhouensis]WFT76416.1 helix-turn-helix domain-containing protein [Halobacillus naozhouensis]
MNIETLRNLQPFPTKKELDLRVRAFLYHHKPALSEGTLAILKYIWRHSVKYPGVSFAKVETIQNKTSKSRSTVIRAINCLEKKGLLSRVPTIRPNGKRGVNILVFREDGTEILPEPENRPEIPVAAEPPCEPVHIEKTQPEAETVVNKDDQVNSNDSLFLPAYIPESFISVSRPFLSPHEILSAWKGALNAYKYVNLTYPIEWYLEQINQTFKQAVFAKREGTIKKNFLGYFYGGLKQTFTQAVRKEVMADSSNLYYDWLEG